MMVKFTFKSLRVTDTNRKIDIMPTLYKKSFTQKGFTLLETIIALGLLGIFIASVIGIFQLVLQNIGASQVRAKALALAQDRMERIRNLSYTSLGTVGGIPNGNILANEQVSENGAIFIVTTSIQYIDDPYDSVAPVDLLPSDYKRVRIEVTWSGLFPSTYPVTLVTNVAPKGIESNAGGGTLIVQILDAQGAPISGATVTIKNTVVTPNNNIPTLSDGQGLVSFPGAPACVTCYEITTTKYGYSTDKTYSTTEVTNPSQPFATIIAGQLTQLTLAIDKLSALSFNSYNTSNQPYPGVGFVFRGSKTIGYDALDNPVYKYVKNYFIQAGQVASLEWDTYTLDYSTSQHTLVASNPLIPITVLPNTVGTINLIHIPKISASLLVVVQNAQKQLQYNAVATLSSALLGFTDTKVTPATSSASYGQVFFSPLAQGVYDLAVSLDGYQLATSSVTVTTNQRENVTLSQ